MRRAAVVLGLATLGCGPSGDDIKPLRATHCPVDGCTEAGTPGDAGAIVIPPEPLESWDTGGAGPLTGIFALQTTVAARVFIDVETRQLFRLRIVQHGTELHQIVTLCSFKLPNVEGVAQLDIPPPMEDVLRSKPAETTGDFLSSAGTLGARYAPPPVPVLAGAALVHPTTDPLPKDPDLSRAVDEDHDGHPGVTLLAKVLTCKSLQDLYVALRTSTQLGGTVRSLDELGGVAQVSLDLSTLGYSDPCLAAAAGIRIDIQPDSPLEARRVGDPQDFDGNGNVSCPEIALAAPSLFGDFWR